jgi:hypothetical protein
MASSYRSSSSRSADPLPCSPPPVSTPSHLSCSYNRLAEDIPCMWCRLRLLTTQGVVKYVAPHRCFGLLGVDLMVDVTGRPWLLEVNNCPNISGATGHVARDARAAAWRGDTYENRASKNYEVGAARACQLKFCFFSSCISGESCCSERYADAAWIQGTGSGRLQQGGVLLQSGRLVMLRQRQHGAQKGRV